MIPAPPDRLPGHPVTDVIPAGSMLRRVHQEHPADSFNPAARPTIIDGGRFDSLRGDYAYAYLAEDDDGAIAETIARDLPFDGNPRLVAKAHIAGRRLSSVRVDRDLRVLVLHGAALSQIGAGLWLTTCEADDYLTTRAWADWLLTLLPEIDGFRYRCRHDEDCIAYVLFDQETTAGTCRARGALAANDPATSLETGPGRQVLLRVLAAHNATVAP